MKEKNKVKRKEKKSIRLHHNKWNEKLFLTRVSESKGEIIEEKQKQTIVVYHIIIHTILTNRKRSNSTNMGEKVKLNNTCEENYITILLYRRGGNEKTLNFSILPLSLFIWCN